MGIQTQRLSLGSAILIDEALRRLLQSGSLWVGRRTHLEDPVSKDGLVAPFLIPEIDLQLSGGLSFGQLHEWHSNFFPNSALKKRLIPPHLILCSLFRNVVKQNLGCKKAIIWIGKECWPSAHILNLLSQDLDWEWQKQVLLLDPKSKQDRLSAFRSCLRSISVLATIGDASGLNLIATRQLQFAVRMGGGIGILLRRDASNDFSAYTKWLVEPSLTIKSNAPLKRIRALNGIVSWNLSLLKAPGLSTIKRWEIESSGLGLSLKQKQIAIEELKRDYGS